MCQAPDSELIGLRTPGRLAQAPLQRTLSFMPNRPRRLDRVFQHYDPPLYFVTFNTHKRQKLLANAHVHDALIRFAHEGEVRGIGLGRYVIMPDHVHLFVRGNLDFVLRQWVRMLKRFLSSEIPVERPHWQHSFFDHVIRHRESYAENGNMCDRILCAPVWSRIRINGLGRERSFDSKPDRCRGVCVERLGLILRKGR